MRLCYISKKTQGSQADFKYNTRSEYYKTFVEKMKQFLSLNEQESCYKCFCELFNIFWCFRFEKWYDNSVSINSIFIDEIDSLNSKIDNYLLLTTKFFIDFYRILKKINRFYRLLSIIDIID